MPEPTLALAIPTYNRPEILQENLVRMLPELKEFGVPVYISDDSTNEETGRIVETLRNSYEQIYYRRNTPGLGHDRNCLATLAWPSEDYVWYLGDSLYFREGTIGPLLRILTEDPSLIFVNAYVESEKYSTGIIQDPKAFLVDTLWYLTLSGATVYGPEPLRGIREREIGGPVYTNFMQLGLILEHLSNHPSRFYWWGERVIQFNKNKTSYWLKNAIKVFVLDWIRFVESFGYFSLNEKNCIIKSHAVRTNLFGLINLINIRSKGGISLGLCYQHRYAIKRASNSPLLLFIVVSIIPKRLVLYLSSVCKFLIRDFHHLTAKIKKTQNVVRQMRS